MGLASTPNRYGMVMVSRTGFLAGTAFNTTAIAKPALPAMPPAWNGIVGLNRALLGDRVTFGSDTSSQPADPVSPTDAPARVDKKTKPHWFKERLGQAFRVGLNVFHVGVGLFLLAGLPFLHGHLAIALSLAIGLQLLQQYLRHKYPDTTVINPKMMVKAVNEFQEGYQKRVVEGGAKFLRKIPLIRRLEKPYVRAANFFGEALRKGGIVMAHLMGNTIISQAMPKTFIGKLVFVTQMVLVSFIEAITGPFGKIGKYVAQGLMWLFRLKDTASNARTIKDTVINALKDFDKPAPKPAATLGKTGPGDDEAKDGGPLPNPAPAA